MPRPRLPLFEREDQPRLPAAARDPAIDCLHVTEARFGLHRPAVPLLGAAPRADRADRVVDLCRGRAGPIPAAHRSPGRPAPVR